MIGQDEAPPRHHADEMNQRLLLGTPEQLRAESMLLQALHDEAVLAVVYRARAELRQLSENKPVDYAASLDASVDAWTNSLIMKEINDCVVAPNLLWSVDNTPREWLGHRIGGVGVAGDNPDGIYRTFSLLPRASYEVRGRFDPRYRAAQLVCELHTGTSAKPHLMKPNATRNSDFGGLVTALTDRDLVVDSDGHFTITFGARGSGANHVNLPHTFVTGLFREVFSDWHQRACHLGIRRVDTFQDEPLQLATLVQRICEDLPEYIRFWGSYSDTWFGGLDLNKASAPSRRERGWGFVSGVHFRLRPDDALIVTVSASGAPYTGIQLTNPWMIAADARRHQTSLNRSQSSPSRDGLYRYVIARTDPGAANWLDTAGLDEGFAVIRWQGIDPDKVGDDPQISAQLVKVSEVTTLADVARIAPAARRVQLLERGKLYVQRTQWSEAD